MCSSLSHPSPIHLMWSALFVREHAVYVVCTAHVPTFARASLRAPLQRLIALGTSSPTCPPPFERESDRPTPQLRRRKRRRSAKERAKVSATRICATKGDSWTRRHRRGARTPNLRNPKVMRKVLQKGESSRAKTKSTSSPSTPKPRARH